jgi:Co/Zn/Cd efflux system component
MQGGYCGNSSCGSITAYIFLVYSNNKKSKAFEEGKRAAWVYVWTLLGIGVAEVIISTTTGSLTLFADGLDSIATDTIGNATEQ